MRNYIYGISVVFLITLATSCSGENTSETLFQENGTDWTTEGDAQWHF